MLALGGPLDECAELGRGPRLRSSTAGGTAPRIWWLHACQGADREQTALDRVAEGGSDELVEVGDGLRGERLAAAAAADEEEPVERADVLGTQPTQRCVAEVGKQVVLDGLAVAGVGRAGDGGFAGR